MKNNKIIILIAIGCGFGDQYASILTGYRAFLDLKEMGYKPQIGFLNNNMYFSPKKSLDIIYDMSSFNTEILNIQKNYFIEVIQNEYVCLEKGRKTILIYVDEVNDELLNYEFESYDRYGVISDKTKSFEHQFLQKEILDIANDYLNGRTNINGIHFRCNDVLLDSNLEDVINNDEFYGKNIKKLEDYLKNNADKLFMFASNNHSVKEYFISNHKNLFVNKFTYDDLKLHNIDANNRDDSINIAHSKEILAEMSLFKKCDVIYEINTFPSNFLTYGIIHNEIHKF
jgi:hypothetical protein